MNDIKAYDNDFSDKELWSIWTSTFGAWAWGHHWNKADDNHYFYNFANNLFWLPRRIVRTLFHITWRRISLIYNPSQGNTFGLVYIVLPALAFVVNVVLRFYSDKVSQNENRHFGSENTSKKPLLHKDYIFFSLGFVLAIPLLFLFTFFTSFSSRHERLIFICLFQITTLSLALPIVFILKNNPMKKVVFITCLDPVVHQIGILLNILKKLCSPAVTPLA